jgi:hypothetical protein
MKLAANFFLSMISVLASVTVSAQEIKTLSAMKPLEAAAKLEAIGELKSAAELRAVAKTNPNLDLKSFLFADKKIDCWKHSNEVLGFVAPSSVVLTEPREVVSALNIAPDFSLKDQSIKITLDRLRVFCYPGKGMHNILFDFSGQHQAAGASEDVHFSQIYPAQQGEAAGAAGYPIFIGLKLGKEGLRMRARTVNVSNVDDEKLLSFMDSDTFKNGLSLINSTNPLTPVVTKFATGLFETIGKRNENQPVQNIDLGLDFSTGVTSPKLSQGSYISIQTENQNWNWNEWKFYPESGQILSADGKKTPIPYNYVIFRISKIEQ